jgi:hypothetical protein
MADIISTWNACETSQLAADIETREIRRIFCSLSMLILLYCYLDTAFREILCDQFALQETDKLSSYY